MFIEIEKIEERVLIEFGEREDFLEHLNNALRKAGYVYDPDAPCTCEYSGAYGHEPCCGWIKKTD